MEIKEVDPSDITVDEANERQSGTAGEEFIENVKATGIIQPPLVRDLNGEGMDAAMGAEYSVVVGGRRVDAATRAGVDKIPVIVMPWDDSEALLASITENIDAFREEVDEDSRAIATRRAMTSNDLKKSDLADQLGVPANWVGQWLEPLNPDWEGTKYHAEAGEATDLEISRDSDSGGEKRRVKKQATVRRMTPEASPEEREQVMETVEEKGLSLHDVEEVKQQVDRGQEIEEAIETVEEQSAQARREGDIKVSTRVVFTGDYAEAIEAAAMDRSASDEQVVRTAVEQWLSQEGYL